MAYINSVLLTVWNTLYPDKEFDFRNRLSIYTMCNSIYLLNCISGHFEYRFRRVFNGLYSDDLEYLVHDEVKFKEFKEASFISEVNAGLQKLKEMIAQNGEHSREDWVAAMAVAHYFKAYVCPSNTDKADIVKEILGLRWCFSREIVPIALDAVEVLFR